METGFTALDRDIETLHKLLEGNELRELEAALLDQSISIDQIEKLLPPALLNFYINLYIVPIEEGIIGNLDEKTREHIFELKKKIDEKFPHLAENAALRKHGRAMVADRRQAKPVVEKSLRPINTVIAIPAWMVSSESADPYVRILFVGEGDSVLLDSTIEIDDFSLLIASMMEALSGETEKVVRWLETSSRRVEFDNLPRYERAAEKISLHLEEVRNSLDRIKTIKS